MSYYHKMMHIHNGWSLSYCTINKNASLAESHIVEVDDFFGKLQVQLVSCAWKERDYTLQ